MHGQPICWRPGVFAGWESRWVLAHAAAHVVQEKRRVSWRFQAWLLPRHEVVFATVAGIALGVAFATVAVIIIGATIRMTVLARAKEITIMRLVGATDMFIRLPFLIDGLVKGVLGGLLALLFVWIANRVVNEYFIQTIFFNRELVFVGVVGGALMGVLGSLVSVGRHLRRV